MLLLITSYYFTMSGCYPTKGMLVIFANGDNEIYRDDRQGNDAFNTRNFKKIRKPLYFYAEKA